MKPKYKIGCKVVFKPYQVATYSINHKNVPMTITNVGKTTYGKYFDVIYEENGQVKTGNILKKDTKYWLHSWTE